MRIGQSIRPLSFAIVALHEVIASVRLDAGEGLFDALVFEAEDLVMIGVRQFVKNHRGLARRPFEELARVANLNAAGLVGIVTRSEEHTSELQSPYVISYAVF